MGFSVKGDEERKFTGALTASKLAAAATAAALVGLVAQIAKVADGYEQLFYASQRTFSGVGNIQAFSYAMSQLGGTASGAASSLEGIGAFLRNSPGSEGFMRSLGIQTRDANGQLRDTTDLLGQFGKIARTMPYYQARGRAQILGIDERTLQALMRDTGVFSAQLREMYRRAGIDSNAAAKGSAQFMQQLRGFGAGLQVLRDKVAISLQRGVGGDIERLRVMLVDNFGRISAVIVGAAGFVIKLGDAFIQLTGRAFEVLSNLYDRFTHLDAGTKGWIETIGALAIAWRLLNVTFAASPIGRLLVLGTALLALYDDYRVFKEGGQHLIDWKAWQGDIDAALDIIGTLKDVLVTLWDDVKPYLLPLVSFFRHEFIDAAHEFGAVLSALVHGIDNALHGRWAAAGADMGRAMAAINASGQEGIDAAQASPLRRAYRYMTGITTGNEAAGVKAMMGAGYTQNEAEGMVGSLEGESNLDPRARQAGGPGVGIAQWSPDRIAQILKGTGINVGTADFASQMKAVIWELSHTEQGAGMQLLAAGSRDEAVHASVHGYERSANQTQDERIRLGYANDIHGRLVAGGMSSTAVAAAKGGAPVVTQTNTFHITGAGDPVKTGQIVARKQDQAKDAIVRNLAPLHA